MPSPIDFDGRPYNSAKLPRALWFLWWVVGTRTRHRAGAVPMSRAVPLVAARLWTSDIRHRTTDIAKKLGERK